jgi:uncharacterized repeat protein (TIGR03803 family)
MVSLNGTNGANPYAGLVQAEDGNLYGTTKFGGSTGNGTIFRFTLDGALTTLASFNGGLNPLQQPISELVLHSDGTLYGIASGGTLGFASGGCLFRMTTNGVLTQVIVLPTPGIPLLLASDGNLYVTTAIAPGSIRRVTLQKITGLQMTNGCALLSVAAIPDQSYLVQATTDLNAGSWLTISTNLAGAGGLFQFQDFDSTNHAIRFYRTVMR